ncbi:MAG: hypothetical protein IFK94_14840 [Acidobacteria bacterium]|uniref:Squalene cyclase C-terminal domain-containing protein n=1 Tax=Candidatus Polarisedimenticola svalbardensis TaxID=2886004 RepID=A0A8J6Y8T8_9BACT|nr:hypothetical protein [Candidatus Polarisedimenticola svalbardensis]
MFGQIALLLPACLILLSATATPPVEDPIGQAVQRAGNWLVSFPEEQLRFDAAIGLHGIRQRIDSDPLQAAWERAARVAERDSDNPMRRFWLPDASSPREATSGWIAPGPADERVNTNRVIAEALHCRENGWRPETTAYIIGPMRDEGGYHTVHGLWALTIARSNGCIPEADFRHPAELLLKEIRQAQAGAAEPHATLEIDLFAERLLMTLLANPAAGEAPDWAARLLALQNEDGSWGTAAEGERAYYRYHATMTAAWALAEYSATFLPRE